MGSNEWAPGLRHNGVRKQSGVPGRAVSRSEKQAQGGAMQRERWESALLTREAAEEAGSATGCTFEFWEHGQSGEVFAVRLGRDRRVTGCKGPLFSNQIRSDELSFGRFD